MYLLPCLSIKKHFIMKTIMEFYSKWVIIASCLTKPIVDTALGENIWERLSFCCSFGAYRLWTKDYSGAQSSWRFPCKLQLKYIHFIFSCSTFDSVFPFIHFISFLSLSRSRMVLSQTPAGHQIFFALMLLLSSGSGEYSVFPPTFFRFSIARFGCKNHVGTQLSR